MSEDKPWQFQKGNSLWRLRGKAGPTPKLNGEFAAQKLLDLCVEYFKWNEDNPLISAEAVKFQGEGTLMQVPKMRPMTLAALCVHLGIANSTWAEWRKRDDLSEVIQYVENVIWSQKFEGAAADMLNASIISRDLGLVDKTESKAAVGVLEIDKEMSAEDAAKAYTEFMGG